MKPSTFKQSPVGKQKILPWSILDGSSTPKVSPVRKQKILHQWITHLHYFQRVHSYYSSVSFSSLSKSWKVEYSSLCISTPQLVFTIPSGSNSQDYSCIYPLGIEYASTIEKCRYSDRERDQGQLEAKASLEKVEKKVKKTRGTSHLEKFEVRALDRHHRDYIILLFVGLAHKSTFVYFSFFFLSDPRIVSH